MTLPKHSIITLTYNRAAWLEEAIRSIEAQTEQDYEHLVLDNGSTDPRVADVLVAARERRPRNFSFFRTGVNVAGAIGLHWNTLLDLATGKYITILDDDNRKRPSFLADMSALMEAVETIEAVTCGWAIIDGEGKPTGEEKHSNLDSSLLRLFRDNTIDSNAVMFRRSVLDKIGRFDSELSTNEDWDFMIRLMKQCRVVHLENALLEYRVHGGARSRDALVLGAYANWKKIRDRHFTQAEQIAFLRQYEREAKKS